MVKIAMAGVRVAETMAAWHVPGLAIGAVRDGQVVIAKGYGLRDVETQLPVTERTLMGIGSNPQMVTLAPVDLPELGHPAYGMGLGVSTYRGRTIVSHGGGIDGFISAMSWLPEERIGIVVLSSMIACSRCRRPIGWPARGRPMLTKLHGRPNRSPPARRSANRGPVPVILWPITSGAMSTPDTAPCGSRSRAVPRRWPSNRMSFAWSISTSTFGRFETRAAPCLSGAGSGSSAT